MLRRIKMIGITTTRIAWVGTLILALVFSSGRNKAWAQQSDSSSKGQGQEQKLPTPGSAYRVDYSINELEDGKKINTRQYSLNLNDNDANELKIGTRVPVEAKQGEMEYIDV